MRGSCAAAVLLACSGAAAADPPPPHSSTATATSAIRYSWLFNCSDTVPYAHNVILEVIPRTGSMPLLAAAFQAGNTEGGAMHLRFTTSSDGGVSWRPSVIAVPSADGRSAWGPVLKWVPAKQCLLLYYAFSVNNTPSFGNPGGDLLVRSSVDLGDTWGRAALVWPLAAFPAQQPKYFVNQIVTSPGGGWVLPYGATAAGYPRTEGSAAFLVAAAPLGGWVARGVGGGDGKGALTIPPAPYVSAILEPAAAAVDGRCVAVLRSGNGWLYRSEATDAFCANWTAPRPLAVPNPNSRPSLTAAAGGLVLAANPDNDGIDRWPAWGDRSLLTLQRSADAGLTWVHAATIEQAGNVSHCYPSVVSIGGRNLVTAYSVYEHNIPRIGIKVAMNELLI